LDLLQSETSKKFDLVDKQDWGNNKGPAMRSLCYVEP